MKTSGFTLIELLAVIVILAIIALIAVPIVLNIVNSSNESSLDRTKDNYLKSVQTSVLNYKMNGNKITKGKYLVMDDGSLCQGNLVNNVCDGIKIDVEVDGNTPKEKSTLTLDSKGNITAYKLILNDSKYIYNDDTPAQPTTKTVYAWYTETKNKGDKLTGYTTDPSTLNKNYYLKHILDSEDKITNSYVCVKFNETTERCLEGGPNDTYGWVTTKTDSTGRVAKLYEIEQENISNVCCDFDSYTSYCSDGSVTLYADSFGYVGAFDDDDYCSVRGDGSSNCESR